MFFQQIYKLGKSNVIHPKILPTREILCAQLSFVKQYTKRTTVQMNNNRS